MSVQRHRSGGSSSSLTSTTSSPVGRPTKRRTGSHGSSVTGTVLVAGLPASMIRSLSRPGRRAPTDSGRVSVFAPSELACRCSRVRAAKAGAARLAGALTGVGVTGADGGVAFAPRVSVNVTAPSLGLDSVGVEGVAVVGVSVPSAVTFPPTRTVVHGSGREEIERAGHRLPGAGAAGPAVDDGAVVDDLRGQGHTKRPAASTPAHLLVRPRPRSNSHDRRLESRGTPRVRARS